MRNRRDMFVEKAIELGDYLHLILSSEITEDSLDRRFNLTYMAMVGDRSVVVKDDNYTVERNELGFHEYNPLPEALEEISDLFIDTGYHVFEIPETKTRDVKTGLVTKIQANVRPCQD